VIEYIVLIAGALLAAIVSGATGFGFALTATAVWMQWLPPQTVAWLCVVLTLVLNVAYLPYFWRDIELRRVWPFVAGGLVGVPLGVAALRALPTQTLRVAIGAVLAVYAAYALASRPRPALALGATAGRVADGGIGFAGGCLGGLGGLSGFLPALWSGMRGWTPRTQRATVQAYILAMNVFTLAWLASLLAIDAITWRYTLAALPAAVLGGVIGLRFFRRLDATAFRRAVLYTLLVAGVLMMFSPGRSA
jgi:hypothetical protein